MSANFVDGCDFCAIARGADNSAEVIAEAEDWIAFFPVNPATPGHTLVVPKAHVTDLWDLDGDARIEIMDAVIEVGRVIKSTVHPQGMNLITSAGKVAEQTVFHLHLHLVPRWKDDGFGHIWPSGERYENVDLGDVADRIRAAVRSQNTEE